MTRPNTRLRAKADIESKNGDAAVEQQPEKTITKTKSSKSKEPTSAKVDSSTTLKVGSIVPDLKVLDDDGEEVSVLDLAKESAMVIFIYPKANTPGCTKQACGFRDEFEKFASHGYRIYGLSADSPSAQSKWKETYNLGYNLLSDKSRELIKAFGSFKSPNSTLRSHVIVKLGGEIEAIEQGVSPADSVEQAVSFVSAE